MQPRSTTALAVPTAREQAGNEVFLSIFLPYSCRRFCIRSLSDPSPTNSWTLYPLTRPDAENHAFSCANRLPVPEPRLAALGRLRRRELLRAVARARIPGDQKRGGGAR